jgi:hypothetical protein
VLTTFDNNENLQKLQCVMEIFNQGKSPQWTGFQIYTVEFLTELWKIARFSSQMLQLSMWKTK